MRRPFLAGNWKMNLGLPEAIRLAEQLRELVGAIPDRDVAVFPSFVGVAGVIGVLEDSPIRVGGQTCHPDDSGAFTGEVSAPLLRSTGATLVLVGHSERRHVFGETDKDVAARLLAALNHRLQPILCVGETLKEREAGETLTVIERQVRSGLAGVSRDRLGDVTLAYEPVWAIGTGKVATPDQAQEVHAAIRNMLKEIAGATGEDMRILYGGSVKGSNVDGLMAQTDIDGALVGGAALDADEFTRIVRFQPA